MRISGNEWKDSEDYERTDSEANEKIRKRLKVTIVFKLGKLTENWGIYGKIKKSFGTDFGIIQNIIKVFLI